MREIARRAGVSLAAVSAVVNNADHTRMSAATRERVENVIAELGYVPNQAARSLRRRVTGTLALVLHKSDNPVLHETVHGVHVAAAEFGRSVILGDAQWFTPGGSLLSQLLGEGVVDGIVVHTPGALDADVLRELRRHPRPVVAMENMGEGLWVAIDDVEAGRLATQHLIDLGHRSIAWAGDPEARQNRLRRHGYARALRAAGLHEVDLPGEFGYAAGRGVVDALTRLDPRPTAVVAHASTAIGVIGAAFDSGLAVPGDLSVVGIHDLDVAEHVRPALTCVRAPLFELGVRAVRLTHAAIAGEPVENDVITDVPNTLVVRDSTAAPPTTR